MSKKRIRITIAIIVISFLILGGIAGYFVYYYYNQYNQLKTNPQLLASKQTQEIVSQVSNLMNLPTDEVPQVATVVNPSLVQSHTPFSQTQTGEDSCDFPPASKPAPGNGCILPEGIGKGSCGSLPDTTRVHLSTRAIATTYPGSDNATTYEGAAEASLPDRSLQWTIHTINLGSDACWTARCQSWQLSRD